MKTECINRRMSFKTTLNGDYIRLKNSMNVNRFINFQHARSIF